jgi:hypothetical protein
MELLPPEIGRTHSSQLLPVIALHGMIELHDKIKVSLPQFHHISKPIDFKYAPPLPHPPTSLKHRNPLLHPQIPSQQAAARTRLSRRRHRHLLAALEDAAQVLCRYSQRSDPDFRLPARAVMGRGRAADCDIHNYNEGTPSQELPHFCPSARYQSIWCHFNPPLSSRVAQPAHLSPPPPTYPPHPPPPTPSPFPSRLLTSSLCIR